MSVPYNSLDSSISSTSSSATLSRSVVSPDAKGARQNSTYTPCDSIDEDSPVKLSPLSSEAQFVSLHDLLERAGYKETRIVTPDRRGLADMAARQFKSPHSRVMADVHQDSPSRAAEQLKKAVQNRTTAPRGYSSKSLPSRSAKIVKEATIEPELPPPLSSWLSNLWIFGPGLINKPVAGNAVSDKHETTSLLQESAPQPVEPVPVTQLPDSPKKPVVKKTASQNQVWTASVAYRSAKSRTAPVRGKGGVIKAIAAGSDDATAGAEWTALQNGVAAKKRPGLVNAFASPSKNDLTTERKKTSRTEVSSLFNDSPTKQRKWRQDRAAWRESLGDLQAMMDRSRQRREASSSSVVAPIEETHETRPPAAETVSAVLDAGEALAKLLSGPALPFLSMDPAVAPRNGACTRPAHLSMRRMKSVEVLNKIIKERKASFDIPCTSQAVESSRPGGISTSRSSSSLATQSSAAYVNGEAGNISPSSKRSTPPRLTLSSPRGITSPQDLKLAGQEYEPWSPHYQPGAALISTRRLAKKSRSSRLRHATSTADLRRAARSDEDTRASEQSSAGDVLKAPRSRTKSRPPTSSNNREQVGSIVRSATGTLSRAGQIQALRQSSRALDEFTVFQDPPAQASVRSEGGNFAFTDHAAGCKPLKGGSGFDGESRERDEDDVFRCKTSQIVSTPDGNAVLKKKHFTAKITKTSKIMRLIDEAENIPSIAAMISSAGPRDSPTPRHRAESRPTTSAATRTIPLQRPRAGSIDLDDQHSPLSCSLSKKSKDRMQTITRVLGQRNSTSQVV